MPIKKTNKSSGSGTIDEPQLPIKSDASKIVKKGLEEKKKQKQAKKQVIEKIPKEKLIMKDFPTLKLKTDRDIALDFAQKIYQKFDKIIKSIILFGSTAKNTRTVGSDIDIVVIVDDAMIKFDEQLIAWYREELGTIVQLNPYKSELHINTIKLTTWWNDLNRGDPTILNIIRYGEAIIDFGGFFNPQKILLEQGRIKLTPESIYTALNRVPEHITRSKRAEIGAIEGCFWAMLDASQAALMAIKVLPPSPEHVPLLLKTNFVDKGLLKMKYVDWYRDLFELHKKIFHGDLNDLKGEIIDGWQGRSVEYFKVILKIIEQVI